MVGYFIELPVKKKFTFSRKVEAWEFSFVQEGNRKLQPTHWFLGVQLQKPMGTPEVSHVLP